MRRVDVMSSLAVGDGSDSSMVWKVVLGFVGDGDGGDGRLKEDQLIEGILRLSSIPSVE